VLKGPGFVDRRPLPALKVNIPSRPTMGYLPSRQGSKPKVHKAIACRWGGGGCPLRDTAEATPRYSAIFVQMRRKRPSKQKRPQRAAFIHSKSRRDFGAGEGLRILDPNLGKPGTISIWLGHGPLVARRRDRSLGDDLTDFYPQVSVSAIPLDLLFSHLTARSKSWR
jgi:hypothetical protein